MIRKKNKSILVFITNGMGEIDLILPYLWSINRINKGYHITVLCQNYEVYSTIKTDRLWKDIIKKISIKLEYLEIYDFSQNSFFKRTLRYFKIPFLIANLFFQIIKNRYLLIDYGNIRSKLCIIGKYIALALNKKIIAIPHTSNPDFLESFLDIPKNIKFKKREILLSIDKYSYSYNYYILGFKKQIYVGNPRKSEAFKDYIGKFSKKTDSYILIFSYRTMNSFFTFESKIEHIKDIYNVVRKFYGNKKILIKPHPRETAKELTKIISILNIKNISISYDNSLLLIKNSILTIGIATSASQISLYFDKPSINYFLNLEKLINFLEVKPQYSYLKLNNAFSKSELEKLILNLNDNSLSTPKRFKEINNQIKDIFHLV